MAGRVGSEVPGGARSSLRASVTSSAPTATLSRQSHPPAPGDPASSAADADCEKYSDDVINAIATEKIFFSRIDGYTETFTKYSGEIAISEPPGLVIQGSTLSSAAAASPSHTPGYGAWTFFHQQDWYQADTGLGAP